MPKVLLPMRKLIEKCKPLGSAKHVRVVTPSYGMFHKVPGSELYRRLKVRFAGRQYTAKIFKVPLGDSPVKYFVIEHPLFSPQGSGRIYVGDEPGKPYEIDAAKFAFFNATVAVWVNGNHSPPDVLHLNDWHIVEVADIRYRHFDYLCHDV